MTPNPTPPSRTWLDSSIVGLAILLPCLVTVTIGMLLAWGTGDRLLLGCLAGLALACAVLTFSLSSGLILYLACHYRYSLHRRTTDDSELPPTHTG